MRNCAAAFSALRSVFILACCWNALIQTAPAAAIRAVSAYAPRAAPCLSVAVGAI